MHRLQRRAEFVDIETGGAADRDAEIALADLAAEREPLEVEEAGGAFQVGQRVGGGEAQALEFAAAGHLPAQHVHQRDVVALQHPEQGRHIGADVVDHLGRGAGRPAEEHPAHAHERLHIGLVRDAVEARDDAPGEAAFATHPRRRRQRRLGIHF